MPVKLYHKTIRRVLLKQGRKFKRAVLLPAAFLAFVVAFILLSPVWVPIALLLHARDQKRMYLAAEGFRCIECGAVLGKASIERADDEWKRYMDELHRQNPGDRFRVVRTVHAICIECEKQYRFCKTTNRFIESQMPNQSRADL
jgi:hypothetical protein